jgi:hypothetical protein
MVRGWVFEQLGNQVKRGSELGGDHMELEVAY